jgi:dipeptidyl aminopeptidase/acylaminoacyl peptidase
MLKTFAGLAAVFALMCASASAQIINHGPRQTQPGADAPAEIAPYIDPRSAKSGAISPNGQFVAYVHRDDSGQQIVVVDMNAHAGRTVAALPVNQGEFYGLVWKNDNRLVASAVIFAVIQGHEETGTRTHRQANQTLNLQRVFAVNRDGTGITKMFEGQMSAIYGGYGGVVISDILPDDPQHILLEADDTSGIGVWKGDITTGAVTRVADGIDVTRGYDLDGAHYPVLRYDELPDYSGYKVMRRASGAQDWIFVQQVREADGVTEAEFQAIGAGPGPNQVYVIGRPNNRDTAALYLYNTATGDYGAPIQEVAGGDAANPWVDRYTRQLIATCEFNQRYVCTARDPSAQRHIRAIDTFHAADYTLVGASQDGSKWLLYVDGPVDSGGYYVLDRTALQINPVADAYPALANATLAPTSIVTYQAHDGAQLWAYVTALPGSGPRPTVIFPHGGPEARDEYGYDSFVQFLASRGYVVVQPNFRGGAGFGRAFASAGYHQWGRLMQSDVSDATQHMIDAGVADPHKICIVGGSYGGYAALAGATLTPNLYACAVSIAGVSDLAEAVSGEVANGGRIGSVYQYWTISMGDPHTDRDALNPVSPRQKVSAATPPVLLIHGEDDDIVPIHQSEMMQSALNGAGHQTRFIRVPHEGHHWDEWTRADRLTLYRETETFLAQYLGAPATASH